MTLWIPFFIILSSWIPFFDLHTISTQMHHQCLEFISFESQWRSLYEALLCGKKLPEGFLKRNLVQGGLIHLMVVSGAHLLFLERFWKKMPLPFNFKTSFLYLILFTYALCTQLYPPITRSLFSFCLFRFSQKNKLFFKSRFITNISFILCLLYKPSWIYSLSLQLSWFASLSQTNKSSLKRSFFTYLILIPILNSWQSLHPITIVTNWLLAPLIGSFLFPLTLLSGLFYPIHFFTDKAWGFLFSILQIINLIPAQNPLSTWSLPKDWRLTYMVLILLILYIINNYKSFYSNQNNLK